MVYLVGAGPGDPDLITVRGRRLLERCDALVFDALANPVFVEQARVANPDVELHDVGKRGGAADSARQDEINALLVRLAGEGKRVVRLKGGDPFVFGRGSEEALALAAASMPFEVVPGITAGIAAPAYAGIPVTHRGVATSVTFVTGHEDPTKATANVDWSSLARAGGSIVLYMGVKALPRIVDDLMAAGMPASTPAASIQWGTYPRQQTVVGTIGSLVERVAAASLSAPVITIIGDVVALRDDIEWFESRPLSGTRIVVTRATAQASGIASALREHGADVIEMPAIRIESLNEAELDAAAASVARNQWAVFTSRNAVDLFWASLDRAGLDSRALHGVSVAAIGPSTAAALAERGIRVDVQPKRFVAEALLEAILARSDVRGCRILYVAAEGARDTLSEGLRDAGATVDVVTAYRAARDGAGASELRARLERGDVDLVTIASVSAVQGLVDAVGADAARRAPCASIGPITSDAARAAGLTVSIEAREATIDSLVASIVESANAPAASIVRRTGSSSGGASSRT